MSPDTQTRQCQWTPELVFSLSSSAQSEKRRAAPPLALESALLVSSPYELYSMRHGGWLCHPPTLHLRAIEPYRTPGLIKAEARASSGCQTRTFTDSQLSWLWLPPGPMHSSLSLSLSLYEPWGSGQVKPLPPHANAQLQSLAGLSFLSLSLSLFCSAATMPLRFCVGLMIIDAGTQRIQEQSHSENLKPCPPAVYTVLT